MGSTKKKAKPQKRSLVSDLVNKIEKAQKTKPSPIRPPGLIVPTQAIIDAITPPSVNNVGVKRALLIGINYIGTNNRLNGCINDVINMRQLLISEFSFKAENIVLMSDEIQGDLRPTKQNITNQINKITSSTKSGDTVFVHYSGHGSQLRDTNGDESTNLDTVGMDDCICPADFQTQGFILDDTLKEILVNKIPVGAKLRAFFDCCHSGSCLDLEFLWKNGNEFIHESANEKLSSDCVLISGCKDSQTSADSWNAAKQQAMGALTMMIIKALVNSKKQPVSWKNLVVQIRTFLLNDRYDQIPMLSVGDQVLGDKLVDL